MRYAIISDIHSNLEALTTVFKHMESQNVDQLICLGDIVGYGAFPNECCEQIFSKKPYSIIGNHDRAALNLDESENFNPLAKEAAHWTYNTLDEQYKSILTELPEKRLIDDLFYMVHGALTHTDDYLLRAVEVSENQKLLYQLHQTVTLCFYGHTHIKKVWCNGEEKPFKDRIELEEKKFYFINPGSVGQPRDGDPRSSYITFDTDTMTVEYHLLQYNIEKAMLDILEAGLPSYLAYRLARGT